MSLLSADEAAELLGVSRATLYAYVSRGLLDSLPGPDRSRRYRREEIERLRLRKQRPAEAAEQALFWGMPSLRSEVSHIEKGELLYRGRSAVELAWRLDLPSLAALLWQGELPQAGSKSSGRRWRLPFFPAALAWLGEQWETEPGAWDLSAQGIRRSGWRIFQTFYAQLGVRHELLQAALTLCADHELNASTFAARVCASTGANPYAVVAAALATLTGPQHGGACAAVEALFREAEGRGARAAVMQRLKRGEPVPGFGHRLYPDGDPRARALLERMPHAREWVEAGQELLGAYPAVDLALVALALGEGKAFEVFATGRCLGWIAHALEQYQDGRMIRPRAGL